MDGQRRTVWRLLLIWLFVGAVAPTPAVALDPTRSIVQMSHRVYTSDDGLPGGVSGITQTPDGYLWVGTHSGLYRFDGVRFERFAADRLLSANIFSLTTTASGDLWVVYTDGGASRLRDGNVVNYSSNAGGPATNTIIKTMPNSGVLWALIAYVPARFDGRRWREVPGPWARVVQDSGGLRALELGRDGTTWAKDGRNTFYCRPGCTRFVVAPGYGGGVMGFARDRDGRVWTSDNNRPGQMYAMPDLVGATQAAIPGPAYGGSISQTIRGRIFLDREGTLWNVNNRPGLLRVRSILKGHADPAQIEAFSTADGLSSDYVASLFEDREGMVWVATNEGLDRFRPANFVLERQIPVSALFSYNAARVGDQIFFYVNKRADNNSQNVSGRGQLYCARADGSIQVIVPEIETPSAMSPAMDGGLWLGMDKGLYKLRNGTLAEEEGPPGTHIAMVQNVAEDANGLWVSTYDRGVWHRVNRSWSRVPGRPDISNWEEMALDTHGVLWLAEGHVIRRYLNGELHAFPAAVVPDIGFNVMIPTADGVLLGGDRGLASYDGHQFHTLRIERMPVLALINGVVEADGHTWIASQAGILRFDSNALKRAMNLPNAPLPPYDLFDRRDGIPGTIQTNVAETSTGNITVLGPDGRVWLLTDRGVAWIDPRRIYRNAIPPPVAIRSLTVNGRAYTSPHDLELPAGASKFEIDYAALSFVEPRRVRFRYRLDGVDNDWVDPGDRRQAFYTRLEPGAYNFHVIATNDAGVWNLTGAAVKFTIAPTFVQSIWFKILVVLVLVTLAWLAYSLRLRQETARLQSRFNVRIAERERIARELHDTLLQGCQGLLLRFQSIANRIPPGDALHKEIEDALDRADVVLTEGRARVRDLRTSSAAGDLAHSLVDAASNVIEGDEPRFQLTVEGEQRSLNSLVGEEVLRVFEEAVRNISKHASAKKIDAVLAFGRQALRLSVRDDGIGMAQSRLTANESTGHFGIVGMRERTERIGARLQVASREGGGTEVVMVVPARVAYKRRPLWPLKRRPTSLLEEAT